MEDLPAGDWARRRGEKVLLGQARTLDASDLARAGRHLAEVVDPDAVDRRLEAALEREERAAHLDRYLTLSDDRAGGVRIRGRGSAEDGALLKAALLPLTCPTPAVDDESRRPQCAIRGTTAPGSGTPCSPWPTTRSTPTGSPTPTPPPPDS